MMPGVGCLDHVPCRAVNCSGVNAGSSVAPRNVHLHVTARRSEAMLSFRISVGGSPLLNLGPAVPDRPVLRIVPAWRTEILIVPTLERADRHAQYLGRGVSTDAVWITPGTVDSKLAPAGFREFVNVDGHGRLQRLLSSSLSKHGPRGHRYSAPLVMPISIDPIQRSSGGPGSDCGNQIG